MKKEKKSIRDSQLYYEIRCAILAFFLLIGIYLLYLACMTIYIAYFSEHEQIVIITDKTYNEEKDEYIIYTQDYKGDIEIFKLDNVFFKKKRNIQNEFDEIVLDRQYIIFIIGGGLKFLPSTETIVRFLPLQKP